MSIILKDKKYFFSLAFGIIFIIIVCALYFNSGKSSYEIIDNVSEDELITGEAKCENIIKYLENKYNEKFHITYKWYNDEWSRLAKISAYSYKNPDDVFEVIEEENTVYSDTYLEVRSKENVKQYFYNIINKCNISKTDFSVKTYKISKLKIDKNAFDQEDSISFKIYLDNEKLVEFEKVLPEIARELNNSVSFKNSDSTPNFHIYLYTKDTKNYNDYMQDDTYAFISIYNNHIGLFKLNNFPDDILSNSYIKIENN